jgi:hypothetical protein
MPTSSEHEAQGPAVPGGGNGFATASLVTGVLGFTAIGVVLGLLFGGLGLRRSRRGGKGQLRCLAGIVAALLWAGAFVYVVPHVIKAADPGCTAFKEVALSSYDRAIEDFDHSASSTRTSADLRRAIASIQSAAAKSRNTAPRTALRRLDAQLRKALADAHTGQVPGSVMQSLNYDASAADGACGTL